MGPKVHFIRFTVYKCLKSSMYCNKLYYLLHLCGTPWINNINLFWNEQQNIVARSSSSSSREPCMQTLKPEMPSLVNFQIFLSIKEEILQHCIRLNINSYQFIQLLANIWKLCVLIIKCTYSSFSLSLFPHFLFSGRWTSQDGCNGSAHRGCEKTSGSRSQPIIASGKSQKTFTCAFLN